MSEEVQHKIVIHSSDVPDEMSEKIVNVIVESCDNFQIEKVRAGRDYERRYASIASSNVI